MLKKNTPSYVAILFGISIINIIFSTYFITFLLIGIVFRIFSTAIRKEHNYIVIFCIVTFLIIENTQGVKLFSLTIITLIVHYLIIPRVKHLFSSQFMSQFVFILCFYILFYISTQSYVPFDPQVLIIVFINFIIDIILLGFIL